MPNSAGRPCVSACAGLTPLLPFWPRARPRSRSLLSSLPHPPLSLSSPPRVPPISPQSDQTGRHPSTRAEQARRRRRRRWRCDGRSSDRPRSPPTARFDPLSPPLHPPIPPRWIPLLGHAKSVLGESGPRGFEPWKGRGAAAYNSCCVRTWRWSESLPT
jgi:hypothetical protein